ncbi:hypothetical protein [Brumimicrobium mesophilum]|uniref:hypothetical protein n=1 Tax=Brumimicrobium mesophilum TaxID=392717 RepID=UPI000D13FE17|nr:hypothetical protein [Brumimicrobium mesophilum]
MNNLKPIDKISARVLKNEYLFISLTVVAFALKPLNIQYSNLITIVLLSTVSLAYVLAAQKSFPEEEAKEMNSFFFKLGGIASGIAIIGILFNILDFPNSKMLVIVGSTTVMIILGIIAINKDNKINMSLFSPTLKLRFLFISLISIVFLLDEYEIIAI